MIFNNANDGNNNNATYLKKNSINISPTKTKEALEYATMMHKGKTRKDGSDYIYHPIRVANYIANLDLEELEKYKNLLVISGYLHDTIEDTDTTYYDIANRFNPIIASLVLELTNDEELKKEIGKTKLLQIKMTNMTDLALIIKLADRLDNIKDSVNSNDEFRIKCLKETIEILIFVLDNRDLNKIHIFITKEIIQNIFNIIETYSYKEYMCNEDLSILNNKIKEKRLT